MSDINTRVNELIKSGYNKTLIKGMLKVEGYTNDQIKAIDDTIPSKKADQIDAEAIMSVIIDGEAENMSRKDIAQALANDGLCKLSTANHIMSLMKFVKAYHKLLS
jgi:hypothetical protein